MISCQILTHRGSIGKIITDNRGQFLRPNDLIILRPSSDLSNVHEQVIEIDFN